MDVTESELIEALQRALQASEQSDGGALTARELGELLGWGERKINRGLHILDKQGRLEVVYVTRRRLDGAMGHPSAYRIKAQE